ncbi:MarR family winged helix-turn-helix transcriptional regulator [Rhodopseudomonas sp. B29]|uniref:MarR family winged helix-turn-helix transcriptional regulator n=1 Tax=Rhodopseudomonas sp. B29 TaxID=95607 RepID=UPI0003B79F11|nr:MarR family transcriptional regulator [Rhodopseudomonas sp. B29]
MRQKTKLSPQSRHSPVQPETARRFTATVASVHSFLDDIRAFFAKGLGITGPQFSILTAIQGLDEADGVSVRHVAKALHVDPSFITTQTKLLEKKGMIRRQADPSDARVVKLSLSNKATKQIDAMKIGESSINDVVYADMTDDELEELNEQLSHFKFRLEKICLRMSAGL